MNTIDDNKIQFSIDDGNFLEILLLRARGETIKFASKQKKFDKEHEKKLKHEIRILEGNSDSNLDTLLGKKKELEQVREKLMRGIAIRSRAQWLSEGEKPTKYFCSLEKFNYIDKTIKCIKLNCGKTITDQEHILKEVRNFYAKLFSAQKDTNSFDLELLLDHNVRKLQDVESAKLEGELELNEVNSALKKMKNNKCSGIVDFIQF